MPARKLLNRLDQLGLTYQSFHHAPLKTVEDAKTIQHQFLSKADGGGHIKNLYLRDRKKRNHLVVAEQDQKIDLKRLSKTIDAAGLSFGSPERLMQNLGVLPGAVSPLAMITGATTGVTLHIEQSLRDCNQIYMHPLINTQTVSMSPTDLEAFLISLECSYNWVDLNG